MKIIKKINMKKSYKVKMIIYYQLKSNLIFLMFKLNYY